MASRRTSRTKPQRPSADSRAQAMRPALRRTLAYSISHHGIGSSVVRRGAASYHASLCYTLNVGWAGCECQGLVPRASLTVGTRSLCSGARKIWALATGNERMESMRRPAESRTQPVISPCQARFQVTPVGAGLRNHVMRTASALATGSYGHVTLWWARPCSVPTQRFIASRVT